MKITFPLKVLVPLALGVLVSLGILAFAELGYRRLETANRLTSGALAMQAAVNDVLARAPNYTASGAACSRRVRRSAPSVFVLHGNRSSPDPDPALAPSTIRHR